MKLAVFYSDYKTPSDPISYFKADKMGIILVANGVYHAVIKENGKPSPLLEKKADFYVLTEDLETRGFNTSQVDSRVKPVTYGDVVDLIFNEYEKLVWV